MRNRREKYQAVILAAAGLLGIVLLAAALGSFTFATPYQLLSEEHTDASGLISYTVILRMAVIFLLLVPLLILLVVRSAKYRRWMLVFLLIIFGVVYAIVAARPVELPPEPEAVSGSAVETLPPEEQGTPQPTRLPPPDPGAPRVTPALVWLVSLGLAGLVLVAGAILVLALRFSRSRTPSQLELIADSAETALQDLERGEDVRGAIMRCYLAMLSAASERGVDRPGYLTPAEFVQRLVQVGLPPEAVERLTRLFEAVRYSAQPPTPGMEAEAVDCLQLVVQAARGTR